MTTVHFGWPAISLHGYRNRIAEKNYFLAALLHTGHDYRAGGRRSAARIAISRAKTPVGIPSDGNMRQMRLDARPTRCGFAAVAPSPMNDRRLAYREGHGFSIVNVSRRRQTNKGHCCRNYDCDSSCNFPHTISFSRKTIFVLLAWHASGRGLPPRKRRRIPTAPQPSRQTWQTLKEATPYRRSRGISGFNRIVGKGGKIGKRDIGSIDFTGPPSIVRRLGQIDCWEICPIYNRGMNIRHGMPSSTHCAEMQTTTTMPAWRLSFAPN